MCKLSNKNGCYTNSVATTICASAGFRHCLRKFGMFANWLAFTFFKQVNHAAIRQKRSEYVCYGQRAEKNGKKRKKGQETCFLFVYTWEVTLISHASYSKIPLYSNETAPHLPENTTLAFNLGIKATNVS